MNRHCLRPLLLLAGLITAANTRAQSNIVSFQFRSPRPVTWRVEAPAAPAPKAKAIRANDWLRAWPANGSTNFIELGNRVVLQLAPGGDVNVLLQPGSLRVDRVIAENTFILQAPDAWTAVREAHRLAQTAGVQASHPVSRGRLAQHGPYAPRPNDPLFQNQWHLENRGADGAALGADLNVRAAWPFTHGEGVTIAVCDDGFELDHPDLASRAQHTNHFTFVSYMTNGQPPAASLAHGTAVAGLIAAEAGNQRGVCGVAPLAQLASLVIFDAAGIVSDEARMDMFQFHSNSIAVQNHSWGNASQEQLEVSLLEKIAISNAVSRGRGGRGVVMVRSGGNSRDAGGNVNDDGYASDPRVIAVGAVRSDGRAARYSNPGAPLLVAAPSAESSFSGGGFDPAFPTLVTTDRQGSLGYNPISYTNDLADYAFDYFGFGGTSGSAPQISGLAGLLLSANPSLTVRDVQQILILSARHVDMADPDIATNGAGFRVSHNTGFGVPDAGEAVRLARLWVNRPPRTNVTYSVTAPQAIPDDGLRLIVTGPGITNGLLSLQARPGLGPHPDAPTAGRPLVDVGQALTVPATNLTGKGALIQRGGNFFFEKIENVAKAGAGFAVIYNNPGGADIFVLGATDFAPIPAVFISQAGGETLRSLITTNAALTARLQLTNTTCSFNVTNALLCEHIGLRLRTDHPVRGDLRVTLVSPGGTRSVLQRLNADTAFGLTDWTYYSTHHFFESSFGMWTLAVTDENPGNTGTVLGADLIITGVAIADQDHDGLDDHWELAHFGTLAQTAADDFDDDGYSNMREQIMGTNPRAVDAPFQLSLDLSVWNGQRARLSWPGSTNLTYEIRARNAVSGPLSLVTNVPGKFPETEFFPGFTNSPSQFFQIRTLP